MLNNDETITTNQIAKEVCEFVKLVVPYGALNREKEGDKFKRKGINNPVKVRELFQKNTDEIVADIGLREVVNLQDIMLLTSKTIKYGAGNCDFQTSIAICFLLSIGIFDIYRIPITDKDHVFLEFRDVMISTDNVTAIDPWDDNTIYSFSIKEMSLKKEIPHKDLRFGYDVGKRLSFLQSIDLYNLGDIPYSELEYDCNASAKENFFQLNDKAKGKTYLYSYNKVIKYFRDFLIKEINNAANLTDDEKQEAISKIDNVQEQIDARNKKIKAANKIQCWYRHRIHDKNKALLLINDKQSSVPVKETFFLGELYLNPDSHLPMDLSEDVRNSRAYIKYYYTLQYCYYGIKKEASIAHIHDLAQSIIHHTSLCVSNIDLIKASGNIANDNSEGLRENIRDLSDRIVQLDHNKNSAFNDFVNIADVILRYMLNFEASLNQKRAKIIDKKKDKKELQIFQFSGISTKQIAQEVCELIKLIVPYGLNNKEINESDVGELYHNITNEIIAEMGHKEIVNLKEIMLLASKSIKYSAGNSECQVAIAICFLLSVGIFDIYRLSLTDKGHAFLEFRDIMISTDNVTVVDPWDNNTTYSFSIKEKAFQKEIPYKGIRYSYDIRRFPFQSRDLYELGDVPHSELEYNPNPPAKNDFFQLIDNSKKIIYLYSHNDVKKYFRDFLIKEINNALNLTMSEKQDVISKVNKIQKQIDIRNKGILSLYPNRVHGNSLLPEIFFLEKLYSNQDSQLPLDAEDTRRYIKYTLQYCYYGMKNEGSFTNDTHDLAQVIIFYASHCAAKIDLIKASDKKVPSDELLKNIRILSEKIAALQQKNYSMFNEFLNIADVVFGNICKFVSYSIDKDITKNKDLSNDNNEDKKELQLSQYDEIINTEQIAKEACKFVKWVAPYGACNREIEGDKYKRKGINDPDKVENLQYRAVDEISKIIDYKEIGNLNELKVVAEISIKHGVAIGDCQVAIAICFLLSVGIFDLDRVIKKEDSLVFLQIKDEVISTDKVTVIDPWDDSTTYSFSIKETAAKNRCPHIGIRASNNPNAFSVQSINLYELVDLPSFPLHSVPNLPVNKNLLQVIDKSKEKSYFYLSNDIKKYFRDFLVKSINSALNLTNHEKQEAIGIIDKVQKQMAIRNQKIEGARKIQFWYRQTHHDKNISLTLTNDKPSTVSH